MMCAHVVNWSCMMDFFDIIFIKLNVSVLF